MTQITIGTVRLSYAHLVEPYAFNEDQEPRYSASLLIDKDDKETLSKVKYAIQEAFKTGQDKKFWGKDKPARFHNPLRDGDEERPDDAAYAGKYYINAKNKYKPGIVDRRLQEIIDPSEIYSGMYANVSIAFFPFSRSGNKGISASLQAVQKVADGDPFGATTKPAHVFEVLDDDDEDNFVQPYEDTAGLGDLW